MLCFGPSSQVVVVGGVATRVWKIDSIGADGLWERLNAIYPGGMKVSERPVPAMRASTASGADPAMHSMVC